MPIAHPQQITKTLSKMEDELINHLVETIDFSKIPSGGTIDVSLSNPEHLYFLKTYGRRIPRKIENLLQNAIARFWSQRMADVMVPSYDSELLAKMLEDIAPGAEKTRNTLVKQQQTKLNLNKKLEWVFNVYRDVLGEIHVSNTFLKSVPLSMIGADDVNGLVCFECTISGMEAQQAVLDGFETEKMGRIDFERYNKDIHGPVRETYYSDFQYYWLEENTKEYSKKKILRKIPGQAFDKFVGRFETGDKVRVIGFYRTMKRDKKSKSPAMDVEIEIINMEKLEADVEITLPPAELAKFAELAASNPDEYVQNITSSFAPHIVENTLAKLALLLAAVGSANLGKYRNHIHVYLVGNPGTAKSELLKALAKVRHLAVYADAPNASARGLMYSQEDWGKRKILKAGLVVKNELLALDELDKMGETRQELNTTMEQQFASYHKNPFDIETPINCTVAAAGNPQNGRWVDGKTLMDNLKPIESELLSRFLIIRVFKSSHTGKRLRHILDTIQERESVKPAYAQNQIAGLISHCRKTSPRLTSEAEKEIIEFAEFFEGIDQDSDSNLPFETRQEIDIIRISTAFAKLLQRKQVDSMCVRFAIKFLKECLQSLGIKTEGKLVEMNLNDQAVNRDEAWAKIIRDLQKESDDGCFSEVKLFRRMLDLPQFWKTQEAAHAFWNRYNPNNNKTSEFYEPHPGRYRKI